MGFRANPCLQGLRKGQSVAARDPSSVIGATGCTFSDRRKIPCRDQGSCPTLPAMPFLMLGEALVDLICEQAAEAGARATESWGAVA